MASIKKIDSSYNQKMLDIIESSPMKASAYDLIFDFGPDIFSRNVLMPGKHQFYGIFEDETLVGFGKMVDYEGYFSGSVNQLCYFGNCFIHANHQRKGYFTQLIEFFIIEFNRSDMPSVGYFVFFKGNYPVDQFFKIKAKQIEAMPVVCRFFDFKTKTLIVTRKKKIRSPYSFRLAKKIEYDKIHDFFDDNLEPRALMSSGVGYHLECKYLIAELNGEICGVCEIVDLGKYKKTRVLRYKKGYKVVFYMLRFVQGLLDFPIFPKGKEVFRELYINRIIREKEQQCAELDFVNWVYNYCCKHKYHLLHIGSYSNDPFFGQLKGFLSMDTGASVLSVHRTQSSSQFELSEASNASPFIDFKFL